LNGSQHLLAPRFSVQLDLEASGQHRDHLLSEAAAFLLGLVSQCAIYVVGNISNLNQRHVASIVPHNALCCTLHFAA
jgi:hypothetical protein